MSNSTTTRHQSIDANQWQYPESWKIFQLKDILDSLIDFRGRTPLKIGMSWGGGDIPALSANNVEMGRINLEKETYYGSEALYRKWMNKGDAEEGDILLTMEAPLGNVAQIPDTRKYILSQRTILLKTKRDKDLVLNGFLKHQLMSDSFQNLLRSYSTGTTATGIQQSKLLILPVVIPPSIEQQKIAHILDTIDNLITLTDRHIAKLKLAKAGLLHDLLTRGIDENGELRDPIAHPEQFKETGIGRIPKNWKLEPLGTVLSDIEAGKSPSCPDRPAMSGEWGVLKVSAVHPEGFKPEENKVITNSAYVNPKYQVRNGDLLITRANTYDLVGLACLVENPPANLLISDKSLRLKPDSSKVSNLFINFVLQMPYVRSQIQNSATGSSAGMKNISQGNIRDLFVALAEDLSEQDLIVSTVHTYNEGIRSKEKYREKLNLLKKGLMADLLTGRVRVNLDTIKEN